MISHFQVPFLFSNKLADSDKYNPTNTEIWMEFKHPAGWGGLCHQLVPKHCRERVQVIGTEKPGTTVPTQPLASTFLNSHVDSGKVAFLPQVSPDVIRGRKQPIFAQK